MANLIQSQHQVDILISTSVPQVLLSWFKGTFEEQGFFQVGQSIFYLHLNSKIMILLPCALHVKKNLGFLLAT